MSYEIKPRPSITLAMAIEQREAQGGAPDGVLDALRKLDQDMRIDLNVQHCITRHKDGSVTIEPIPGVTHQDMEEMCDPNRVVH